MSRRRNKPSEETQFLQEIEAVAYQSGVPLESCRDVLRHIQSRYAYYKTRHKRMSHRTIRRTILQELWSSTCRRKRAGEYGLSYPGENDPKTMVWDSRKAGTLNDNIDETILLLDNPEFDLPQWQSVDNLPSRITESKEWSLLIDIPKRRFVAIKPIHIAQILGGPFSPDLELPVGEYWKINIQGRPIITRGSPPEPGVAYVVVSNSYNMSILFDIYGSDDDGTGRPTLQSTLRCDLPQLLRIYNIDNDVERQFKLRQQGPMRCPDINNPMSPAEFAELSKQFNHSNIAVLIAYINCKFFRIPIDASIIAWKALIAEFSQCNSTWDQAVNIVQSIWNRKCVKISSVKALIDAYERFQRINNYDYRWGAYVPTSIFIRMASKQSSSAAIDDSMFCNCMCGSMLLLAIADSDICASNFKSAVVISYEKAYDMAHMRVGAIENGDSDPKLTIIETTTKQNHAIPFEQVQSWPVAVFQTSAWKLRILMVKIAGALQLYGLTWPLQDQDYLWKLCFPRTPYEWVGGSKTTDVSEDKLRDAFGIYVLTVIDTYKHQPETALQQMTRHFGERLSNWGSDLTSVEIFIEMGYAKAASASMFEYLRQVFQSDTCK